MAEKLSKLLSKDYIEGLKAGLQIAKDVARRNGYDIIFPNVDEMKIEKIDKKRDGSKEDGK